MLSPEKNWSSDSVFSYDFSEIVSILFPSIAFFSDVATGAEVTIEAAAAI